jgi:hypothetical protein
MVGGIEVSFVRAGSDSCELIIRRDDGVELRGHAHGREGRAPHDLVHFVVEGSLELSQGFWGCVAEGAEFKSLELVAGRRRPHATEHSRAILKRARRELTTAEVLTAAVERLTRLRWDRDPPRLMREIERELSNCEPPRSAISTERICRACAVLREHERRWSRLSVGQSMVLQWPVRLERVAKA